MKISKLLFIAGLSIFLYESCVHHRDFALEEIYTVTYIDTYISDVYSIIVVKNQNEETKYILSKKINLDESNNYIKIITGLKYNLSLSKIDTLPKIEGGLLRGLSKNYYIDNKLIFSSDTLTMKTNKTETLYKAGGIIYDMIEKKLVR